MARIRVRMILILLVYNCHSVVYVSTLIFAVLQPYRSRKCQCVYIQTLKMHNDAVFRQYVGRRFSTDYNEMWHTYSTNLRD